MYLIVIMKKIFSIQAIMPKLLLAGRRFPVSVGLVLGLALLLFMETAADLRNIGGIFSYRMYIFLGLGAIISTAAALWLEDFVSVAKQHIITAAITLLWGIYCYFLPDFTIILFKPDGLNAGKLIELSVIGIVASLAVPVISFLRKPQDNSFWKFTMQTVFQFWAASCFGSILQLGLSGAIAAVQGLFGIEPNETITRIYMYVAIFCGALFIPLYFLANIPDKTDKHSEDIALNKTLKIFALYILTPIAAVYAVILYVYLFKIIVTWELPKGLVSWLVSSLMCVGLLVRILLYPARYKISKYFGLIMLPLLALMSVGIFRRFADYGITISRGYILLLNVWSYGICAYVFFTKGQRIKWIFVSFAIAALLFSVGPLSVANITRHVLTAEVNKYMNLLMQSEC